MDVRVSKLTSYIAGIFRTDPILMNLGVIGEISNLKYHHSGAVFFTLKDEKASIRCQMWERNVSRLRFQLENGMEVKATGKISVYEKSGTYSLTAEDIEAVGEGALMAAYRALYEKLRLEGLFSRERKKTLPLFPRKVCIITSGTGAALQDMLKIIRSRNHVADILIFPVLVQGPGAAGEISEAIRTVNERFPDVDVIIAGRGGGSLEDLWAFNEEPVARAISDSRIPLISAVGHETDYTIADFTADVRAETPTAAATLAVPDVQAVKQQIEELFSRGIRDRLETLYRERKNTVERYSPEQLIRFLKNKYFLKSESLKRYAPVQTGSSVLLRMEKEASVLDRVMTGFERSLQDLLRKHTEGLETQKLLLEAGNPERIVERGYAIVTDRTGRAVTSVEGLRKGSLIDIRLRDGTVRSEVVEMTEETDGR